MKSSIVIAAAAALSIFCACNSQPKILSDLTFNEAEFQKQYALNKAEWDAAFKFLTTTNFDTVTLKKKNFLTEKTWARVSEATSKNGGKWEAHRNVIDLFYVLDGTEQVGVSALSDLREPVREYKAENDVETFKSSVNPQFTVLTAGKGIILFPSDSHLPNQAIDKPAKFKVVTVKIPVAKETPTPVQLIPAERFDRKVGGKQVSLYTLKGGNLTMQVTNYGGRVISLWAPDRNGNMGDVESGLGSIDAYLNNTGERFLGAAVGPVCNRIAKGKFTLDGKKYKCPINNAPNTLHGGDKGIDKVVWDVLSSTDNQIVLRYVRPDGQDGFPGNLTIKMTYTLTEANEFTIDYEATTDQATPVNISHHSFFNLSGRTDASVLDNEMMIKSSTTTPIDKNMIPTGKIVSLLGGPMDFTKPTKIGARIGEKDDQLAAGNGYDHNWIIDRETKDGMDLCATVYDPASGRGLEVRSDQPALQFYCGNFFDGKMTDKHGNPIGYRCCLVFETQKYPDAVNHPQFPSTILRPGEVYTHHCAYKFTAK